MLKPHASRKRKLHDEAMAIFPFLFLFYLIPTIIFSVYFAEHGEIHQEPVYAIPYKVIKVNQ